MRERRKKRKNRYKKERQSQKNYCVCLLRGIRRRNNETVIAIYKLGGIDILLIASIFIFYLLIHIQNTSHHPNAASLPSFQRHYSTSSASVFVLYILFSLIPAVMIVICVLKVCILYPIIISSSSC